MFLSPPALKHHATQRQLEHSLDGLLAGSLRDFDSDPVAARLRLSAAWTLTQQHGTSHALVQSLLAKSIAVDDALCALSMLVAAIKHDAGSSVLWSQYWAILQQSVAAQHSQPWQALLKQRLPFVSAAAELRSIMALLKHHANPVADSKAEVSNGAVNNIQVNASINRIGYCRWDAVNQVVRGWALSVDKPQSSCMLTLRVVGSDRQGQLIADAPVEMLQHAGISPVGGFTVRLPTPVDALEIRFEDGLSLIGSPLACVAPMMPTRSGISNWSKLDSVVDVLVPVYEGREATIRCIESLLACRDMQHTPHDIIVLDDASTDQALVSRLQDWARQGWINLVRRPANLGFIRNINRGMAIHPNRDVVWLNSDTLVTGNWLDRLRQAAYADAHTATATPWSNDGEFMTLAGKNRAEPIPSESAQLTLDRMMSDLDLPPVDLVSGCGFCFYVKRQAIDAVGWLDELDLVDGYGEETDWCMRARALGWQHVAATNLFVGHEGGQSFGLRKTMLAHHNNAIIRQRYPMAERLHRDYLRQDPLQSARETIAQTRWKHWLASVKTKGGLNKPSNERKGKPTKPSDMSPSLVIERAVTLEPTEKPGDENKPLVLTWRLSVEPSQLTCRLSVNDIQPALELNYRLPQDATDLVKDLRSISKASSQALTWESSDALPLVLADCVEKALITNNPLKTLPATINSAVNPPQAKSAGKKEIIHPGSGLALIVDDLRQSEMVDAWLNNIRRLQQSELSQSLGVCFVTTQQTPGAQLLRRAGLVAPVNCPDGLKWKEWLRLLSVNGAVTLGTNMTLSDAFAEELDVELPVQSLDEWLNKRGPQAKPSR